MLNEVNLIGRLGKDAELREFDSGSVTSFTLATTEKYKDKSGNMVNNTDWHNCQAWNKKPVTPYLKKGTLVHVSGKIKTRSYEQDGQKKFITEIVVNNIILLSSNEGSNGGHVRNPNEQAGYPSNDFFEDGEDWDSDLPF